MAAMPTFTPPAVVVQDTFLWRLDLRNDATVRGPWSARALRGGRSGTASSSILFSRILSRSLRAISMRRKWLSSISSATICLSRRFSASSVRDRMSETVTVGLFRFTVIPVARATRLRGEIRPQNEVRHFRPRPRTGCERQPRRSSTGLPRPAIPPRPKGSRRSGASPHHGRPAARDRCCRFGCCKR
jgi:hypothetical protein